MHTSESFPHIQDTTSADHAEVTEYTELADHEGVEAAPERSVPAAASATLVESTGAEDDFGSDWDLSTKRTVLVILLIGLVALVWISRPVIPILIISGIVAYLLKPIVDLGEWVRIPRSVTTIFLFLLVLVGIILTPVLVIPIVYRQLRELATFDEDYVIGNLLNWASTVLTNAENISFFGMPLPVATLMQQLQENIGTFEPTLEQILAYVQQIITATTNVVGSTAAISFSVVGGIFQFILAFILTFFISLYLTKDAPAIRNYIEGLFPRSYQPEFEELLRRMGKVWQGFFRGQVALSLIIGFTTWGILSLLSIPGALVLGIVAGALEIIPNLGPTLAMIPAITVALIQGSNNPALMEFGRLGYALMVVGAYFLIQQIENSIIVPRVIGDSVNLHPVIVMCGVIVGFSVGGILGAFLAAPVMASIRVLGSYVHAKLLDYPPFHERGAQMSPRAQLRSYRRIVTGRELERRAEKVERAAEEADVTQTGADQPTVHAQ